MATPRYKYGFLLTTYNDSDQAVKAFNSLKESIPEGEQYAISVVDGGSTEEHIKVIQENIGPIAYTHPDLSSALNGGIYDLLGYQPDGSNIKDFVDTGVADVEYIIWIHVDMVFHDFNWANKLCFCYEHCWPMLGKIAPGTRNIDGSVPEIPLRGGNSCPWVMSSKFIHEFITQYGFVFDPKYTRCGGYEDWKHNRLCLDMGYGFGICSLVDVYHVGMYSRSLYNSTPHQQYNANVYNDEFHTWEQPGFEVDLTELGQDLRKAFEEKFEDRWYNKEKK